MNDTAPRGFRGIWIPAEIWLNERLTAVDKIILAEIDSLAGDERGCFATNESLAKFCQCSVSKVSAAVAKLCEIGYLESAFDGRSRTLRTKPFRPVHPNAENTPPPPSPALPKIDYEKYVDTYNSVCAALPKVKFTTEQRKEAIRTFAKTFNFEQFEEICRRANASDFLTGKNSDRNWKADFDFLIRPKQAAKILEGGYDNPRRASDLQKWN